MTQLLRVMYVLASTKLYLDKGQLRALHYWLCTRDMSVALLNTNKYCHFIWHAVWA